jgi:hypothetical protein
VSHGVRRWSSLRRPSQTIEEVRLHREQKLAGALRLFSRMGFSKGVADRFRVNHSGSASIKCGFLTWVEGRRFGRPPTAPCV